MPQTTNLLNTERKQRLRAERLSFWQTVILIALVVVVGVGGMWSGTVVGQRNHATGEASKNAEVAQGLAARVQAACRLDTDEGRSLRKAGLCAAASSASAQVTAAGKAGAQGLPGPAGPSGASGQPGRDATGKAGAAGSAGASGQPGRDATGEPGASGAPGADSTIPGPAGAPGTSGTSGTSGVDGKPGQPGRGISSLFCSGGDLVVSWTDGTSDIVAGAQVCEQAPTSEPTSDPT
jgi:type IV secretory pathway TrbL component